MSKILLVDEVALKQALEALETQVHAQPLGMKQNAITALRTAIEQAEKPKYDPIELHVLHSHIAGVLFDFMGWLTSREKRLTLSSTDEAGPAVEAITEFAKMRGLNLHDAQVEHWQAILTTAPAAPVQEPVAWVDWLPEGTTHIAKCKATTSSGGSLSLRTHAFKYEADVLKVYTTDNDNEYPGWRAAKDVFYHLNFAIVPIYTTPLYVAEPLAAPVQEPVAFLDWYDNAIWGNEDFKAGCHRAWNAAIKYTTPPAAQRQWVGLTDEEIDKLKHLIDWTATWSHGRFACEIEQLLKEKNT